MFDFIATKAYYRVTQAVSLLFLPLVVFSLWAIRIEDQITVSGTVESNNQVVMRSPLSDTLVEQILVKPGDDVKKGTPLLLFQDLRNWRYNLEKKMKRLELLQEKTKIYIRLNKGGAQSGMTVRDMINETETLKIDIKALKDDINRLELKAPFQGRITELMVKPYDKIDIGTPIVSLSAMDGKIVKCKVPESRFPYLRKGQSVSIKSNQFQYLRYKIYTGEVKAFSSYSSIKSQGPVYETEILLTGEASSVLPIGSTATCEILVEEVPLYLLLAGGNKK